MYRNLISPRPAHNVGGLVGWGVLFALITFGLLTLRSQWIDEGLPLLLHDTRFVLVGIATAMFAAMLWAIRQSYPIATRPGALLFNVVATSALIVIVRCLMDHGTPDDATTLDRHFRWLLVWAGYFSLWIGAFLEAERRTATAADTGFARAIEFVAPPSAQGDPAQADAWAWVSGALAEEFLRQPDASREAILRAVRNRAGYRIVDDIDGSAAGHNARVELAERLTGQLMAERAPWRKG